MSVWLFPYEREIVWRRRRRAWIVLLLAFLLLLLIDGAIFRRTVVALPPARPTESTPAAAAEYQRDRDRFDLAVRHLEESDFYRTFRVAGTLWPWLLIGAGLVAYGTRPGARAHGVAGAGVMIVLAAALSGAGAEVIRIITGRLRPAVSDPPGAHQFKGILERFQDPSNLGFPSSHAAVAFGAAFMVSFAFPGAGYIALLAAAGCGVTRMLAGAHFASDIFGSILLGYAVARLLRPGGWPGLSPRTPLP